MSTRKVPRLVAMLKAEAGSSGDVIAAAVQSTVAEISEYFKNRAAVRGAVPHEDNPLARMVGDRAGPTADDAIVEVTLPEDAAIDDLVECARALKGSLKKRFVADTSTLLAGIAYLIIEGDADVFVAIAARKDPDISVEDMRRWWVEQHAELAKKIIRPQSVGYEQLHVDRGLSQRACEAAGVSYEPFDLFDSINYHELSDFIAAVGDPEIQGKLLADEMGKVDHSRSRGAACRVICRV